VCPVSTEKRDLLHVFEKTGCRRQVDLVRLAKSLTFPV
jgi:DNA-binding CsgD family transcriptional regulator